MAVSPDAPRFVPSLLLYDKRSWPFRSRAGARLRGAVATAAATSGDGAGFRKIIVLALQSCCFKMHRCRQLCFRGSKEPILHAKAQAAEQTAIVNQRIHALQKRLSFCTCRCHCLAHPLRDGRVFDGQSARLALREPMNCEETLGESK
jgi:hypothetical protein